MSQNLSHKRHAQVTDDSPEAEECARRGYTVLGDLYTSDYSVIKVAEVKSRKLEQDQIVRELCEKAGHRKVNLCELCTVCATFLLCPDSLLKSTK